jgi:hypothetical protein
MGQYYRPVLLNTKKDAIKAFVVCYDFGNGAKLMEHSWMKNNFVGFVERQLLIEPTPIVWAGDYADSENGEADGENLYDLTEDAPVLKLSNHPTDRYSEDAQKVFNKCPLPKRYKYLINYDKKEFVDKSKVPTEDGWQIHPLPLLTCEGNGRGGGDFRGNSKGLVGRWARDVIGVGSKKSDIPKDFKEVMFNLTE